MKAALPLTRPAVLRFDLVLLAAVALWLIAAPLLINHGSIILALNDVACGIVVLGLMSYSSWKGGMTARWLMAGIGTWLLAAPLIFWAPEPGACIADVLAGSVLIVASVVVPTARIEAEGTEIPPGWDYNPSSWGQRAPIVLLALLGFAMASLLAAFQLGYTADIWDPFFGDGTERVLTSDISRAFPVSDAGLGALSYLLDALMGLAGDRRRWRTMPWLVLVFGIMIIPTGVVSIVLVMLQPIGVGAWCSLCLATAVVMLTMVSPAIDEVIATWQYLKRCRRAGLAFWPTFFGGGAEPPPSQVRINPQARTAPWPWTLALAAAIGIWLMGAPALVDTVGTAAATSDHLVGALAATISILAMAQILRPVRLANLALAAWLLVAPWLLSGSTSWSTVSNIFAAITLFLVSPPRGRITHAFGGWNRFII